MKIETAQAVRQNVSAFWEKGPAGIRAMIHARIASTEGIQSAVKTIQNITIERETRKTSLSLYTPQESGHGEKAPILFIHGGAWVIRGSGHENLARYLCAQTGRIVVAPDYLNALDDPINGKFPGPLEQCYDALLWIQRDPINNEPDKGIILVGDSAGGNMCSGLSLMAYDRNGPKISAQVLINPAPDLTGEGTLTRQDNNEIAITAENTETVAKTARRDLVRWYATQYLNNLQDAQNPYASPILGNPGHFPPTFCVLSQEDRPLCEDGREFVGKLQTANVPVKIYEQPGGHLGPLVAKVADIAIPPLQAAVSFINQQPG